MPDTFQFPPVKRGETVLASMFYGGAAIMLAFVFVLTPIRLPSDPGFKADIHLMILTVIFLALGTVAWRWRPYKSSLELTDKGIIMSSSGMAPLAEVDVLWKEMVELRLSVVTNRGRNPKTLHVTSQIEGSRSRKNYALNLSGLEADTPDVMRAIFKAAEQNGREVVGPDPKNEEDWVDGLTWKLSPK